MFVEDSGSKFGTYVGDNAIALTGNSSQSQDGRIGGRIELGDGGRVRFGLATTVFKYSDISMICMRESTVRVNWIMRAIIIFYQFFNLLH